MATHFVPDLVGLNVNSLSILAGKSSDAGFIYQPDLAGEVTIDVDDIIVVKGNSRTLLKTVVVSADFNHESESTPVACSGIEDIINTVPWDSVNDFYNIKDLPCIEEIFLGKTISDFINAEYAGEVALWFTSITALGSVGSLLLPELETKGKGFFDVLKEILAPYPHLRWVVEYDDSASLYPLGDLVIYDATEGRNAFEIDVGDLPTGLNVKKDVNEAAEFVHLYGYGDFNERLEVAVPAWPKECIVERSADVEPPFTPSDNIQIKNGDDRFFLDLHLYVDGAAWYDGSTIGGVAGGTRQMRLWPGADIAYNIETGEVRFLFAEDEEGSDESRWWWVNNEDGTVYPPDYFDVRPGKPVPPAQLPGTIRRPVGYRNSHVGTESDRRGNRTIRYHCAYTTFTPEAFRLYNVSAPIANFRIRKTQFATNDQGVQDTFRQEPDALDAFRPNDAVSRYEDFEEEFDPVDFNAFNDVLFPSGTAADQKPFWIAADGNLVATSVTPIGGGFNTNSFQIPSLQPTYTASSATLAYSRLVGFWTELEADVTYEEGLPCLRLSRPQLSAYPQWNDQPVKVYSNNNTLFGNGAIASTIPIDAHIQLYSWPVMIHYTAWGEIEQNRTTPHGLGKHVKNYMQSAFHYTQSIDLDRSGDEPEPVTVFDNISQQDGPFIRAADMLEEYFGQVDWRGSTIVSLKKGEDGWIVPYKVGDIITFIGEVTSEVSSFTGLINAIDLSNIDSGVITLNFGKQVPSRNPFIAADKVGLATDQSGLDDYDPRAPAVERV